MLKKSCRETPKCLPDELKMMLKWLLGAPWGSQKTPSGSKSQKSHLFGPLLVHPEATLGPQSGPKSMPKRIFSRNQGQKERFFAVSSATVVLIAFFISFQANVGGKIDEKLGVLLHIFSSFPTLPKPCILRLPCMGAVFLEMR